MLDIKVSGEIVALFKRHFPGMVAGARTLSIPEEMSLTQLNVVLNRDGFEVWSRFPGLSLRFRKYEKRVRSGKELIDAWYNNPNKECRNTKVYPFYDELWSKPLRDKYAEIKAKGTYNHLESVYRESSILTPGFAIRRESPDKMAKLFDYICAKKWYMYVKSLHAVPQSTPLFKRWSAESHSIGQMRSEFEIWRNRVAEVGAAFAGELLREASFARSILPPNAVLGGPNGEQLRVREINGQEEEE